MCVLKLFYMVYYCFEAKKFQSIFDNISKPIALVFLIIWVTKKTLFSINIFKKYRSITIIVCFKAGLYGLPLL